MITNLWSGMKDFFHAKLCYQLFITPIPWPIEKEYRNFAERACDFLAKQRTSAINCHSPRHFVLHHFAQKDNPHALKLLITHGWMSRAAYMVRLIRFLHHAGYEIYALDFPAHGEAKGFCLTWFEAVHIIRETMNKFGPFYGVIGHSFGGSMLLNALNLAHQFSEWQLETFPQRAVLIASPTSMNTPIRQFARRFKLSGQGLLLFRSTIRQNSTPNIRHLNFRYFVNRGKIPILCLHGKDDRTVNPRESINFCRHYPHASLILLSNLDHVDVLIDKRVESIVGNFLL